MRPLTASLATTLLLSSYAAAAEDTTTVNVPAVTVTTVRAEEAVTPVVYSELSYRQLERSYTVHDMPKTLAELPSIMYYSENGNSIGYSNLSMRGFDQRRIAVLVNGIPQNDPEDHNVYWINMPDLVASLESIQVQRGAGLASYGQPAIGGSINLTSSNFVRERRLRLTLGAGLQEGVDNAFNTSKMSLDFSSGLVDKYAVSARLSRIASDGYRERSWTDLTSFFVSMARFDEGFTTQINVFGGPITDGLSYAGLPKAWITEDTLRRRNLSAWDYDSTGQNVAYAVDRRPQETERFSQPHVEVLNDWTISPEVSLKSSLFYYTGEGFFIYDASWADASMLGIDASTPVTNALVKANVINRHGGWIPRIVWTPGPSTVTLGAEVRWHRSLNEGTVDYADGLPAGYDPAQRIYSFRGVRDIASVFGRIQHAVNDDLVLHAEAQLVHQRYGLRDEWQRGQRVSYATTDGGVTGNGGDVFDVNYLFFNPRVGALYTIDEHQRAFIFIASTSREPRRANLYDAAAYWYSGQGPSFVADTSGGTTRYDFASPLTKPERLLDIEAQYVYDNGHLRIAATPYAMLFTDELVKNGTIDVFGLPVEGNVASSSHVGLELECAYTTELMSWGQLRFWANGTVSRNRIGNDPIAGFPDLLGNVGVQYGLQELTVDIVVKHVGAFVTQSGGGSVPYSTMVDPYTILNASAAYRLRDIGPFPSLRLMVTGTNLLDHLYAAGGIGKEFFPAARRNAFVTLECTL